LDEATFNQNSNNKWKNEHVNVGFNANRNEPIQHTVRKLKPDTVYYFKIQVRSNRAYTASSPTVIYKTPNCKFPFLVKRSIKLKILMIKKIQ
jgi:hypothetical protein